MTTEINNSFKRKLTGVVVSNKNEKTIVVNVQRRYKHSTYSKFITKSKKYHAHDVENKANLGDFVTIIESRPYSKLKKWELLSINTAK
ncbi:MAG: 30S ribosomal protein S17 [Halobacteriovorax sp.]|nr:30S ribosomal protein S17 [Halobacteriovorax sp.]|tara:strand:+ start:196 stop:459 length:264 start_codon:yes stop_codon:yes gene_type:complete